MMINDEDVKKINKIRKLLGNRYHLCVKAGNSYCDEWHLFRKYDDTKIYFSKDNKEIMSSKTNTLEDLMEFAKKHHKIDEHLVIINLICLLLWITLFACLLNAFIWNNNYVKVAVITIDFVALFIEFSMHIIWNKNWKVDMYELDENYKQRLKEIKEDLDGLGNKKRN